MAESNVNIMLDTVRRNRISVIYAVENDYGARFITATIMTDGKKKTIEGTAAVTINAERPDGMKKAIAGSVNEDGTVTVPVTQWMLEFEGEVVCSVSVVTSTSRLTTTHFYIQAQYSVWDGTSAPSADDPNKDVIVSIIAAENERVVNENARISAENVRKTAETARIDAENIRIANENDRVSNEAERVSAETVRKAEFASWQREIGKISTFDKRIENLETAVTPGLVTPTVDDSVAYIKNVPMGALPNAMITEVGGMTRKCTNLWDEEWEIGFIETTTGANATSTARIRSKNFIPAESETNYSYTYNDDSVIFYCYDNNKNFLGIKYPYLQKVTTIANTYYIRFVLPSSYGITYKNDLSISKGETALPYEPYFDGLRDAKVTEIKSVGINIWDEQWKVTTNDSGVEVLGSANRIPVKPDTKYFYTGTANMSNALRFSDKDGKYITQVYPSANGTFKTPSNCAYITFKLAGSYGLEYKHDICINEYNEAINGTYYPYFENIFSIPEAVQNLDGYGQGVNEKNYNKIVIDPVSGVKRFIARFGKEKMKNLSWTFRTTSAGVSTFQATVSNIKEPTNISTKALLLIARYTPYFAYNTIGAGYGGLDKIVCVYQGKICIVDSDYTDVSTFVASLGEDEFVYELSAPFEIDLSDYFGDDNFIEVEGGGEVTMVNEYKYAIPSVIEYTVKGSDVT